jgi:hypothetical protein
MDSLNDIPEPKPAPPIPPAGADSSTATFVPTAVTKKDGETKGKAWTIYTIHNNGDRYTTFDKKYAEDAKDALSNGNMIFIIYRVTPKGNNIELLKLADEQ